jgi:hypothetical protein
MSVLEEYLRRFGRPLEFYTDKASIFTTTPKKNHPVREEPLPPTQIGRALQELGIGWIAAHSPQAKGRVERSFDTDQDRLVKGLRIAGARTLEEANAYLEAEYFPTWKERFTVVPACADNAHRPLLKHHDLTAILCPVEQRVVTNDFTMAVSGADLPDCPREHPGGHEGRHGPGRVAAQGGTRGALSRKVCKGSRLRASAAIESSGAQAGRALASRSETR